MTSNALSLRIGTGNVKVLVGLSVHGCNGTAKVCDFVIASELMQVVLLRFEVEDANFKVIGGSNAANFGVCDVSFAGNF